MVTHELTSSHRVEQGGLREIVAQNCSDDQPLELGQISRFRPLPFKEKACPDGQRFDAAAMLFKCEQARKSAKFLSFEISEVEPRQTYSKNKFYAPNKTPNEHS